LEPWSSTGRVRRMHLKLLHKAPGWSCLLQGKHIWICSMIQHPGSDYIGRLTSRWMKLIIGILKPLKRTFHEKIYWGLNPPYGQKQSPIFRILNIWLFPACRVMAKLDGPRPTNAIGRNISIVWLLNSVDTM